MKHVESCSTALSLQSCGGGDGMCGVACNIGGGVVLAYRSHVVGLKEELELVRFSTPAAQDLQNEYPLLQWSIGGHTLEQCFCEVASVLHGWWWWWKQRPPGGHYVLIISFTTLVKVWMQGTGCCCCRTDKDAALLLELSVKVSYHRAHDTQHNTQGLGVCCIHLCLVQQLLCTIAVALRGALRLFARA